MAEKEQTTEMANFRESLAFLWHLEANLNTEASVRLEGWQGKLQGKGRAEEGEMNDSFGLEVTVGLQSKASALSR